MEDRRGARGAAGGDAARVVIARGARRARAPIPAPGRPRAVARGRPAAAGAPPTPTCCPRVPSRSGTIVSSSAARPPSPSASADDGYFNAIDYSHDAFNLLTLAVSAELRAHDRGRRARPGRRRGGAARSRFRSDRSPRAAALCALRARAAAGRSRVLRPGRAHSRRSSGPSRARSTALATRSSGCRSRSTTRRSFAPTSCR